ncbi:MAG: heavy metal-binding domain-containing protein, partial [Marmoricola sp.]
MSNLHQHDRPTVPPVVKDPVCGMGVDAAGSEHHVEHDSTTYYFCSAHCRAKFAADPGQYIGPHPRDAATAAVQMPGSGSGSDSGSQGQEYTCPMHPEVRQIGPGACPICGMALEPVTVTADSGPSAELLDMTRRFWIALVLSIPVVVLEMGGHLFP